MVGRVGRSAGCTDKSQLSALCFREFHFSKCVCEMRLQRTWEGPLRRSSSPDLRLFFIKLFAAVTESLWELLKQEVRVHWKMHTGKYGPTKGNVEIAVSVHHAQELFGRTGKGCYHNMFPGTA